MRNRKRGSTGASVADAHLINRFSETPGVWISITGAAFYGLYYEKLKHLSLKPSLVMALAIIEEMDGITQSDLARKLKINRASAMKVTNTLIDLNYIEKSQLSRVNQNALSITSEGAAKLDEACKIEKSITDYALADIPEDERSTLMKTLKNITKKLSEI